MRRVIILALLLVALAIGAQDAPNILAGHDVTTVMPDAVFVFGAGKDGVTWTGPLIIEVDGRPVAHVTLPALSAATPRRPIWPYVAAGGLGILLGGWAGASIARALR
jgi:hypothetical protein